MSQLSKTKKTLVVVLVLNLIVWGGYGFVFWKIRAQNMRVSTLLNEAELDIKKDESLRLIKSSLDENKDFLSHIDSFFVSNDGVVGFIDTLESYGREKGVSVTIGSVSVEPDSQNKEDFKERLRLRVEVAGSWNSVTSYLMTLESLPYSIRIDQTSFTLTSSSKASSGEPVESGVVNDGARWKGQFEFTVLKLRQ